MSGHHILRHVTRYTGWAVHQRSLAVAAVSAGVRSGGALPPGQPLRQALQQPSTQPFSCSSSPSCSIGSSSSQQGSSSTSSGCSSSRVDRAFPRPSSSCSPLERVPSALAASMSSAAQLLATYAEEGVRLRASSPACELACRHYCACACLLLHAPGGMVHPYLVAHGCVQQLRACCADRTCSRFALCMQTTTASDGGTPRVCARARVWNAGVLPWGLEDRREAAEGRKERGASLLSPQQYNVIHWAGPTGGSSSASPHA